MSGGQRFKRAVALARAQELIEQLRPACVQIEIAGSLRRGMASVGDIEIVAMPKVEEYAVAGQLDMFGGGTPAKVERASLLDKTLETLVAAGEVVRERPHAAERPAWGDKYKKVWTKIQVDKFPAFVKGADFAQGDDGLAYIQVDIFIVTPPAQWGPLFTIRTGPESFSGREGLMRYINGHTPYRQDEGHLSVRATGEEVSTPTEADYFRVLGLPVIPPGERSAEKLWQVVKGNTKPAAPRNAPTVKALTLHQPWASLIAAGLKRYETRDWGTGYRGLLAIHAGKTDGALDLPDMLNERERAKLPADMPHGAVVCLARLVDVVRTETITADPEFTLSRESRLGNFAPYRYGWRLEVVEVYDPPIPARGSQGLWDWPLPPAETPPSKWRGLTDDEVRLILRDRIEARAGIGER
jgi:hypothetical protein